MLWLAFMATVSGLLIAGLALVLLQYRALVLLERIANALDRINARNGEPKAQNRSP